MRRLFSLLCALLVAWIMAFPPYAHVWRSGSIEKTNLGYSFILDPPRIRVNGLNRYAAVDTEMLLLELGAVMLVWLFMLVALKRHTG